MNDYFDTLTSRSVHPASQALLTKASPLVSITIFTGHFSKANDLSDPFKV